jgi:hypothetical protein
LRIFGSSYLLFGRPTCQYNDSQEFCYQPDETEQLSTAVVTAVAQAHDEDVLDQKWLTSDNSNTDAIDDLFQERNLDMTLRFEADRTTATVIADRDRKPRIRIESHPEDTRFENGWFSSFGVKQRRSLC